MMLRRSHQPGRTARPASAARLVPSIGLLAALIALTLPAAANAQSSSLYLNGDRSQPATDRASSQQRAGAAEGPASMRSSAGTPRTGQRNRMGARGVRPSARYGATPAGRPSGRGASMPRRNRQGVRRVDGRLINPHLQAGSYMAVVPPEPRQFQPQDLVTIIIREESSASSEATLDTEKETTIEGEVGEFPRLRLKQLLQGIATSSRQEDLPAVDVSGSNEFEGEGEYERSDSMVTRLTARVVDVKPNGTLALEARTQLNNDDETMIIKVTGYCRTEDVTADNTVLSTQVFDLRVDKQHDGELRKTSAKGFITKVLETIFNF